MANLLVLDSASAPYINANATTTGVNIPTGNTLVMGTAASRLVPGATSFSLRNNANSADNLIITDAGAATVRAGLTVTAGGLTITAGSFTTETGTASATSGAATLSKTSGVITSEALTTAAGSQYTLTLTNTVIATTSRVFAAVDNGTNTRDDLVIQRVTPGSGSCVIIVKNTHASALNGTIKIAFFVVN